MREKVVFYRDIVQPDETQSGVRIHGVSLRQLPESLHYTAALTLVQSVRGNRSVSGQAQLWVDGLQDGEPLRLDLAAIRSGDGDKLEFSFKFFQELTVDFTLPEGFVPTRLVIWADPQGANNRIERQFDWEEIIRG